MKHVSANNSMTNASASFHYEYLFYLIKNSSKLCLVLFVVFNDIINADLCRQIIQRLVNNKLEMMWNEAEGSKIRYDTDADTEIQKISMRKLGRDIQSPGYISTR